MLRGRGQQYINSIFIPFMLSSFEILLELKSYLMLYETLYLKQDCEIALVGEMLLQKQPQGFHSVCLVTWSKTDIINVLKKVLNHEAKKLLASASFSPL